MTVIDRYFALLDLAVVSEDSLTKLADLFSENAALQLKGYDEIRGRENIKEFFRVFLGKNTVMKHVWKAEQDGGGYRVPWAVSCIGKTGDVYAMEGADQTVLDGDGKILRLKLRFGGQK
ncbi:nuclear transport factor 2 family protein [Caproiciproducens sp.]|uniref:nuclear transport factor 2 family protein n=1 Tax=Caproiciproducens sp. TaxID=1954376 RepID=UPI0028963297|nr:nuclear transport factor 2 family protein [Caproiciproducens sp.]